MKKAFLIYLTLLFFLLTACTRSDTLTTTEFIDDSRTLSVTVVTTTGDKRLLLAEEESFYLMDEVSINHSLSTQATIRIDESKIFQEIDGFGAAMSESSAYLIHRLPEDKRENVIRDLFALDGIRMSFVRIPMGASDFSLDSYTYNDMPKGEKDLTLDNFSIERDEQYVIPVLKDAFKVNNDIKLIASPWSAPAWMKTNEHLNGGSLKPEYYSVYSQYFIKFIQEYKDHGLPMYAVTLQNEPLHEDRRYPSMRMTNEQQREFIKVIGPQFNESNLETLIIAYDHNWDQNTYPYPIYQDELASQYVSGAAYHCYAGDVANQSKVHQAYPNKGIWFTECSGGGWATNFADNLMWNMQNLFIGSINHHSKSVLLWNIALDENSGPKNNGCGDCRGVITISSHGEITKNEEYYSIGHFSKFIEPNAHRISAAVTGNQQVISTSFINPNGEIIVVIANTSNQFQRIKLVYDGLVTTHQMSGKSVSTLVIHKN